MLSRNRLTEVDRTLARAPPVMLDCLREELCERLEEEFSRLCPSDNNAVESSATDSSDSWLCRRMPNSVTFEKDSEAGV